MYPALSKSCKICYIYYKNILKHNYENIAGIHEISKKKDLINKVLMAACVVF